MWVKKVLSKFLLDANVLITPHRQYYPFDFAPSFWCQMTRVLKRHDVFILQEAKDEIMRNEDNFHHG